LPSLDSAGRARLTELIEQRLSGIPLAHITGRQTFMGLELLSEPGALIPRRETEILGRALWDKSDELAASMPSLLAVDVCTGSGNLAVALASRHPAARVFAADLSPEACELARRNVQHLNLQDRVQVRTGDLLAPFDSPEFHGRVDLLSCNPPYISTARMAGMPAEIISHEPSLAFDGGALGVRIIQRLNHRSAEVPKAGRLVAF
jgi:release factor glutamine methyltransferase